MKIISSKRCITPTGKFFPCYLCGHAMRKDMATGISDDIFVSCIRLQINNNEMIWLSFELVGFDRNNTDIIKENIYKKYGVEKNNIIISFVHTHAAPEYAYKSPFNGADIKSAIKGYPEFLISQALLSVDDCYERELTEVRCFKREFEVEGLYGNRNGKKSSEDKRLLTLLFKDNNDNIVASCVNITCHPTVLGPLNLNVSGDLAGYISRKIQERTGTYPLVMQGAAGDTSNRLYRQGNDYNELRRIGDAIIEQWEKNKEEEELVVDDINIMNIDIVNSYTLDLEKKKEVVKDIENRIAKATSFDEKKVYTSALAIAKLKMNNNIYELDFHAKLIKMGDIFIYNLPAELFACFGKEIKNAMNSKCPIVWGYSDYSVGYLVDKDEYGKSFESVASDMPCGTSEMIIKETIDVIKKM